MIIAFKTSLKYSLGKISILITFMSVTGSSHDTGIAGSDAEERLLGDGPWLLLNAEQSLQAFTRGNRLVPRATRGDSGSGSDSSSSGSGSRTGSKPCTDFATRAK